MYVEVMSDAVTQLMAVIAGGFVIRQGVLSAAANDANDDDDM